MPSDDVRLALTSSGGRPISIAEAGFSLPGEPATGLLQFAGVSAADPGSATTTGSLTDVLVPVAQFGIPAVMGFAGAWVQARPGRKVIAKYGDVEIEASSLSEVKDLMAHIRTPRGDPSD